MLTKLTNRLVLAALLLVGVVTLFNQPAPVRAQAGPIYCNLALLVSSASGSLLVSASGTARIFICGWDISGSATGSTVLASGAGTAMTNTLITITNAIGSQNVDSSPNWRGLTVPNGLNLNYTNTGGSGVVYAAQQ